MYYKTIGAASVKPSYEINGKSEIPLKEVSKQTGVL